MTLTSVCSDLALRALGTLLADLCAAGCTGGGRLGLLHLLLAALLGLLLLALGNGCLAGCLACLGSLCAAFLDHIERGTNDTTLLLKSAASALLGDFLQWTSVFVCAKASPLTEAGSRLVAGLHRLLLCCLLYDSSMQPALRPRPVEWEIYPHLRDTLPVLPSEENGPCDATGVLALEEKRLALSVLETEDLAVAADVKLALSIPKNTSELANGFSWFKTLPPIDGDKCRMPQCRYDALASNRR